MMTQPRCDLYEKEAEEVLSNLLNSLYNEHHITRPDKIVVLSGMVAKIKIEQETNIEILRKTIRDIFMNQCFYDF